jgi:hypothetical protein
VILVAEGTRTVEVRVGKAKFADALTAMRVWLDHNDCVPLLFDHGIERPGSRRRCRHPSTAANAAKGT